VEQLAAPEVRRVSAPTIRGDDTRWERVRELRRARPRVVVVRVSVVLVGVLFALAWTVGDAFPKDFFSERSQRNVARFLGELRPHPLQGQPFDFDVFAAWVQATLTKTRGLADAARTFGVAVLAIALAAAFAALAAPLGARTFAARDPLVAQSDGTLLSGDVWPLLRRAARMLFVALRAIPEYVLAFLLMALLPYGAWPAVLALALHNAGILARLQAENLENLPGSSLRALRLAGATRAQLAFGVGFPLALGRFLLYVFYRYETCVREATVLGILGYRTLGYSMQEARSRQFYDEMLLLVSLGVVLVLVADGISSAARRWLRDA
jgi:phosphonate transport system permease protein